MDGGGVRARGPARKIPNRQISNVGVAAPPTIPPITSTVWLSSRAAPWDVRAMMGFLASSKVTPDVDVLSTYAVVPPTIRSEPAEVVLERKVALRPVPESPVGLAAETLQVPAVKL